MCVMWWFKKRKFRKLLGKTYQEANPIAQQLGFTLRVVKEDNCCHVVTADYYENRLNVSVTNNVIIEILYIG